jgi:tetratricopeptide (TPR) repeat protein
MAILLVLSCQGKRSSTVFFEEGQKLFEEKKYDEAIAKYQEGLELSPNSAEGYNLLGMAYRFKYNAEQEPSLKEEEIKAFTKAVELDSTFWVAYVNLGATYYYSGRKKEAVPYFERALELYPEHHEREQMLRMIDEGKTDKEEE